MYQGNNKIITTIFTYLFFLGVYAQAPNISYTTPNVFQVGNEIMPLLPSNSGGEISVGLTISTFSGTGIQGSTNGNNLVATFKFPTTVTSDLLGNVIVADRSNHLIRKITPEGIVSTIAGTGTAGSVDGISTVAKFNFPDAAAIDSNGNIFITDQSNHKIRKIAEDGMVSTFAGTGSIGAVDGMGEMASFHFPAGLTIDANDNLYIADFGNNKIRKISPTGIVSTFAGTGNAGSQDGEALSATFNGLTSIELDGLGNYFIADYYNHKIRKIDSQGNVTTFAGSGISGAQDGNGVLTQFNEPATIAIDEMNIVYVADQGNHKIRKITQTGEVTTFAGSGIQGFQDDIALDGKFNAPTGLTVSNGLMYVCDYQNHRIRKVKNYSFTIAPNLPEGLVFDTASGIISGTPTVIFPETNFTITTENVSGTSSFVVSITVEEALSNTTFLNQKINIAPNPIVNSLIIRSLEEMISIQIFDSFGKEIAKKITNQKEIDWQLSALSKGFYFVKITTLNEQFVRKVIKN